MSIARSYSPGSAFCLFFSGFTSDFKILTRVTTILVRRSKTHDKKKQVVTGKSGLDGCGNIMNKGARCKLLS
jgi:hypothetical protein